MARTLTTYAEEQAAKRKAAASKATKYVYEPVGLDAWEGQWAEYAGKLVVKTSGGPGAPKNGTMGHCFIADAVTGGFIGLVLCNSLRKATAEELKNGGGR